MNLKGLIHRELGEGLMENELANFVNPDLKYKPGHYVVVESQRGRSGATMLRQLKQLGSQYILHPLNRKYDDLPLTKETQIYGKVVRLRKDL